MSSSFDELLNLLSPFLQSTIMRDSIVPIERLAVTLMIALKELVQATGAPELLLSTQHKRGAPVSSVASSVIPHLLSLLYLCPEMPDITEAQIMPFDAFLSQEILAFKKLIGVLQNDLTLLNRAAHGEISLETKMASMLEDVCNDEVPEIWLDEAFATCSSLQQWLSELSQRMEYVKECWNQRPAILSLNMFLRPDRIFYVAMQTFAKQNFKDVSNVTLEFQIILGGQDPYTPHNGELLVNGFELKNACWDENKSILIEGTDSGKKSSLALLIKPILKEESQADTDHGKSDLGKGQKYNCPLYGAWNSYQQSDDNVVWFLPLNTSESPTLWAQRRTSVVLSPIATFDK